MTPPSRRGRSSDVETNVSVFAVVVAALCAIVGWLFGRRKSSGPGHDDGRTDPGRAVADLHKAADEAGELAGGAAEAAADAGDVATDLGRVGAELGKAGDQVDGCIGQLGDAEADGDRLDQLLGELHRRHGTGEPEAEDP